MAYDLTLQACIHALCFFHFAVFEPRYLELFRHLQAAAPQGSSASDAKFAFGHILSASSAPPVLMQDSVSGLPACGVCATVKGIDELENGRLQVRCCANAVGRACCFLLQA
jgi:Lon protease-like protein